LTQRRRRIRAREHGCDLRPTKATLKEQLGHFIQGKGRFGVLHGEERGGPPSYLTGDNSGHHTCGGKTSHKIYSARHQCLDNAKHDASHKKDARAP
jgi:hypothetical protein